MQIRPFFDKATFTLTYVVYDGDSKDAIVIDPVLDYDVLASQTSTESVDEVTAFLHEHALHLHYVLETHAHADHLSGGQLLKRRFDAKVAIGRKITDVQHTFKKIFDLPADFATDGSQFDRLLDDGEVVQAGSLRIEVLATPGHTPACVTYKIGDALFTGDVLFIEDYGTGRCDFPDGSANDLYTSVHEKLYKLPASTRVFVGHDYQPGNRPLRSETTIGAERAGNIQLRAETTRDEYVKFRTERDATLSPPRLLYPSVQINVDAGRLPRPHANGHRYMNIPINLFGPTDEAGIAKD